MIVSGVSSRLATGLGAGGPESVKVNSNEVCGESSDKRVNGESPTSYLHGADCRDYSCENLISIGNAGTNRGKGLTMVERAFTVFKFFIFLTIIGDAGILVSGATNPKGDIKVEVKVPKEAVLNSYADLRCEWRLNGGKNLYSVKWYKDDHEFFRYLPDNRESIQTFVQPGVQLDGRANSKNSIRLTKLTPRSSGQYKCEVSTEGPSFATEYKIGNLTVITLPKDDPKITGLSAYYAVGENVTANCTASPSVPKASLHWTINGKPIPKEYTVSHPPLPVSSSGIPNSLGLRLEAEARHFDGGDGSVSIRCVSYVGSRRYEAEQTVHMAHVNNQRLSAGDHRSGASSYNIHGSSNQQQQRQQRLFAVTLVILGLYVAT